jgi:hypothetical protein
MPVRVTQKLTAREMRKVMLTPRATVMMKQTESVTRMLMATMTATENSTGSAMRTGSSTQIPMG